MSLLVRIGLLLVAALKFGKFGGTLLTMLIAIGTYAVFFGWRYAVGVVAMLLIHELGHYLAATQRGVRARLPMFIPFVGAWTQLDDSSQDIETGAYIALAGPMLGTVAAIAAYFLGTGDGSRWLLAVSYTGFFLNLVNLIPLPPLDGGRVTVILSPRIWLLGMPVLIVMLFYHFSVIFALVAILALPHMVAAIRYNPKDPVNARYYAAISPRVRWEYGLMYIGLIAFLAYMTTDVHEQLHPERRPAVEQNQVDNV